MKNLLIVVSKIIYILMLSDSNNQNVYGLNPDNTGTSN